MQKALSEVGLYPTGGHLVKRVIGVGGDHVVCCDKAGRVTVNGVPLSEKSYIMRGRLPVGAAVRRAGAEGPALGDGRQPRRTARTPATTRTCPAAARCPEKDVVGKVWAIVWPFGRAHRLSEPSTFENPKLQATTR